MSKNKRSGIMGLTLKTTGGTIIPTQQKITLENIQKIRELAPRRICFSADTHKNALRREDSSEYVGKFVIPFSKTIYPIFNQSTGLSLFKKFGNHWRSIDSETEYEQIHEFVQSMGDFVFLRDTLALSIALAPHLNEDKSRSHVGELEYQAKYGNSNRDLMELVELCMTALNILPFYKNANFFCAVPPSNNQSPNLPTKIVHHITNKSGAENITSSVSWTNSKISLKELSVSDKWSALEQADLQVNENLEGKTIILLDDLYQSGLTMQYVAMKLQEAGADKIFGLVLVKSRRDSDNQ